MKEEEKEEFCWNCAVIKPKEDFGYCMNEYYQRHKESIEEGVNDILREDREAAQ